MKKKRSALPSAVAALFLALPAVGQSFSAPGKSTTPPISLDRLPPDLHTKKVANLQPGILAAPQYDPAPKGAPPTPGSSTRDLPGPELSTLSQSFRGLRDTSAVPCHPTMAIGDTHIVQCATGRIAFFSRATGAETYGISPQAFFSRLGTVGAIFRTPSVVYDPWTERFLMMFVVDFRSLSRSYAFLAISRTNTPNSGWWMTSNDLSKNGSTASGLYARDARIATDKNAIFITADMVNSADTFQYSKVRVLQNKSAMINGTAATWWDRWAMKLSGSTLSAQSIRPCQDYDNKGTTNAFYLTAAVPTIGNSIYLFALSDVNNRTSGPSLSATRVSVATYSQPSLSLQKGSTNRVHNIGARLVTAVKRNGSIWTAHSVKLTYGSGIGAMIQWYQIRTGFWPNLGNVVKAQEGRMYLDRNYYTFPSLTVNEKGQAAMVFTRSSTTEYPSLRYTHREASDLANQLRPSQQLHAGEASYSRRDSRGRYRLSGSAHAATSPDGSIWMTGAYASSTGGWHTWIASIFDSALVSPPDLRNREGGAAATRFGAYPEQRIQMFDGNLAGKGTHRLTRMAFRLNNTNYNIATGQGRRWRADVTMSEARKNALSSNFASNRLGSVSRVFSGYLSLPTQTGRPAVTPAPFTVMEVPFSTPWVYSGASDRLINSEFALSGGVLNNGATWSNTRAYYYYLDAPAQRSSNTGRKTTYGVRCLDSASIMPTFAAMGLTTYARDTGVASTADRIHGFLEGRTRPGGTAMYGVGFVGNPSGIEIGACNRIYLSPTTVIGVRPNSSGYAGIPIGSVPFQPSLVNAAVWTQAGWADSSTGTFKLSPATSTLIASQPASPTLWAHHATSLSATDSGGFPSASPIYNPVRKYYQ